MNNNKVTYIQYNMNQLQFPTDLSEWIPKNHIARIINEVVENLDIKILENAYTGGGRSSYHPKMMLKIVLFAYTQKVTSGRKIAKMCQENVPMIWLSGRSTPDFRTINRFRSERLKECISDIFESLVTYIVNQELANTDIYYQDGTKIEANANKFSFVWAKSTKNYQEKLTEKIKEFLREAENMAKEENIESELISEMKDLSEISSDILKSLEEKDSKYKKAIISSDDIKNIGEHLESVEAKLEEISTDKKHRVNPIKKLRKKFSDDFYPRMKKYEKYNSILGKRNSFSKTDHDATFMRMKDDYMKNGQLKAGYNVQIGTNNQYVLNYSIHQNPTDVRTFIPHITEMSNRKVVVPKIIVADAGYSSEENYLFCADNNYVDLIPYNMMRVEEKNSFKKDIKNWKNWDYEFIYDRFICPNNRNVEFKKYDVRKEKYGFKRDLKIYECESCEGCPLKEKCTKSKGNRQIQYNPVYEEFKSNTKEKLLYDEKYIEIYSKRKIEPETVFGNLKANLSFTRFSLRGIKKVKIEFGLIAMAHNLIKISLDRALVSPSTHNKSPKNMLPSIHFLSRRMRVAYFLGPRLMSQPL